MDLLHPVLRSPVPASKENPVSEVMNLGGRVFLFHRKLRPMKQKTLREDAHSREAEICRKRPRSARECAKAHSFLWFLLPSSLYLWRADHRYSLVKQII